MESVLIAMKDIGLLATVATTKVYMHAISMITMETV